jgi:hypothetical protein
VRPKANDGWRLGLDGKARLNRASAHIDALGLELRDVGAVAQAHTDGDDSVIVIESIKATARASSENLQGEAELRLRGQRVVSARATLELDDVPLTLKGASRGKARGRAEIALERNVDHMAVVIDLPRFLVRLPPTTTRDLIDVAPNPEVVVLQTVDEQQRTSSDDLTWRVMLRLGSDVRVFRSDLDLPLSGSPSFEYLDAVRPDGTVEATPGGRITLFDQIFLVERGFVRFVPDEPDNPRVELTASWRAPDGTTVYVDITGRAKQASISTRDDAGLDETARFNLLTGAAGGTETADQQRQATAIAIGQTLQRLGVNQLLRESLGDVSVRIGATADQGTSYTASVRLSDRLWFEGNVLLGAESARRSSEQVSGTLDYRFTNRWSLRTELGTSGGAFDLLWSHRY